MSRFDEMRAAVAEAQDTLKAADQAAARIAPMLVGRLRAALLEVGDGSMNVALRLARADLRFAQKKAKEAYTAYIKACDARLAADGAVRAATEALRKIERARKP